MVDEVKLSGKAAGVRIVVEPAEGGDVQIHNTGCRLIEQVKIRRGGSPWTTHTIVEYVLPDLLKAFGDGHIPSQFRFVTDNLKGTTDFARFLEGLRDLDGGGKGPQDLGNLDRQFRWGAKRISSEGLYARIAEKLGTPEPQLWRFLTSFKIVGRSEAVISTEIDNILAELVTEREEIPVKRKALTQHLLSLGAVGEPISAEQLLRVVDLNPLRLTHAQRLPARLHKQVEQVAHRLEYDRTMDVRTAVLPPEAPKSILSGDSGQGKTWRLCSTALATAMTNRCAILLVARGCLADLEAKIVELIWRTDFDRSLPLAQIADRLRPTLAHQDGVWLTVFIDDLADPGLAEELSTGAWDYLGIRVVVSAQNRITRMLTQPPGGFHDVPVPDFTLAELRDYLQRAGRNPNQVPDDVLMSMVRPILAATYCRIPGSEYWSAVSEYELMDRYWRWATTQYRMQALNASDAYAVLGLAGTLLDGKAIYPWTPTVTNSRGMKSAARDRLITVGILREDAQGALQASHDRVLNWAVAGEIERRFREGELTVLAVAELLGQLDDITTPGGERLGRRFGYVLLDLFWMLARSAKPEQVGELALITVRSGVASREHEHFFTEGLGSLGPPIVPVLTWMARQPYLEAEWLVPRYLASAFIAVAETAETEVAGAARTLVEEDVEQSRSIGLEVLGTVAAPEAMDLLWSINKERNTTMVEAEADSNRRNEQRIAKKQSFKALSNSVQITPDWLCEKALSVTNSDDAEQLIWLLMQLDIRIAKPIWTATKGALLGHLSPISIAIPRSIRYFRDNDELKRIDAAFANPEPHVVALWFDALAYLTPETALKYLDRLTSCDLWGTSHWWLPGLLHRVGPAVHRRLLETLGREQEDGQTTLRNLAIMYGDMQDLLDRTTFDQLMDSFEACLEREERGESVQPGALGHLRELIASAVSPTLLECLAARKGKHFEQLVTCKAISRKGRMSRTWDRDGEEYRLILGAIGGEGYDQLVLAELERPSVHARTDGVEAAAWTRNSTIKDKLEAIAEHPNTDSLLQKHLMDALAAHRADAGLIAMVQGGSPVFVEAIEIRENGPPWTDDHLPEIEALLRSDEMEKRLHGVNLCCFLGGEMACSMLAPIFESNTATNEEVGLARDVLAQLGYYRPTFLRRLKGLMGRDSSGLFTARYLARSGDAEARAAVVDWLAAHPLTELSSSELPIAFRLLGEADSASGALAFLKRVWKKGLGVGREGEILAVLAEAGDSEASIALDAIAYQKPRWGEASVVAAIRALQETSRAEALAAAERFYHRARATAAAHLLLQLDAEFGSKVLLKDYPVAPIPTRHQIGRLLRRAAPRALFIEALKRMSGSETSKDRLAAAELAGWLPFEEPVGFLDHLVDDEAEAVEKAALVALRQRRADAECAELTKKLPGQPRPRQWAWLHALVRRGDPAHLSDPKDPRSIHDLIEQLGDDFREEANRLLKKRSEELNKRADWLERDQNR